MAYRDLLLAVVSYPDATPDHALGCAVGLAKRLGGELTALVLKARLKVPRNVFANAVLGLEELAHDEEARSAAQAAASAERLAQLALRQRLPASVLLERAAPYEQGERIVEHARTRDLCLLPIGPAVLEDVALAEAVLFGSGRPIVIFPEQLEAPLGEAFETAVIAWDGSRAAARAVADALPALSRARQVRLVTFVDEKPTAKAGLGVELVRHLRSHDVRAVPDEVETCGEPIGRLLRDYVDANAVDLLVMGGFGHSRAREFVLGGATSSMIEAPPCPVLMSH